MKGRWLLGCATLALGESLGLLAGGMAPLWPSVVALAAVVTLFGYGFEIRGWPWATLALVGLALALHAQEIRHKSHRHRFWMRGNSRYERRVDEEQLGDLMWKVRREFSRRIGLGLDHSRPTASLNRAILLGERRRLPRETKQVFVEAGTMHIFAISGLHVMVIAKLILIIMACLLLPVRIAGLLALPFLWGYVLMIGAPPSAVRAAMMASFQFVAPLFYRRPDAIVAWAITFIAVHIVSPEQLFNVGSALSFSVMFAILAWGDLARRMSSRLLVGLGATLAAWAAGVPIAAHVFGRITPGGMLANLILLPTAKLSVVSGATGILASFVSEPLAAHFNNCSALFTDAMVKLSAMVAALPGANFEIAPWSVAACIVWYIAIILTFWLIRRKLCKPHAMG